MEEKILLHNNNKLGYKVTGNGPIVVLLHGFGEDGTVWENQYNYLTDYRIIIPDLPGTGISEVSSEISIESMADAVVEVIKEVQKTLSSNENQRVVLIGHSMGGYVGLAIAEKYPDLLLGLGLFHSTAFADSPEKIETRRKGIQFINEHGPYEFLKSTIPNLFSTQTKTNNPEIIQKQIAKANNFSGNSLVSYYNAMINRKDRTNVLKESKWPVLFVLGKYDTTVPLNDGLQQCKMPVFSYIHILENSAHMGMFEEIEDTNLLLKNYLESTLKS
jgi:pimeloyl-ACP methyl ester carboxylesterase